MAGEGGSLVTFAPAEERPVVEHILGHGVQCPVVSFSRVPGLPGDLDETVIEAEVVPDGVLPGRELLLVVGKS